MDIYDVLEARFERVPRNLLNEINQIDDLRALDKLHRNAVIVKNMEEFQTRTLTK